jgi:hypothetical protein
VRRRARMHRDSAKRRTGHQVGQLNVSEPLKRRLRLRMCGVDTDPRDSEKRRFGHRQWTYPRTSTVPVVPSTVTTWSSRSCAVPIRVATTAGRPNSRAMIAGLDKIPPESVTSAPAL